ncbi:MAG: hypothetical protein R2828_21445 [Saprospiraceae bacterium]
MAESLAALSVFKIDQIKKYTSPFINKHNRLEGSPRSETFERSLRAEVRDPLWLLCRQWQFGEFKGEDAGTAYQARILGEHRQPEQIKLNDKSLAYQPDKPLETLVEREVLAPDLQLRSQMGRHLQKIMKGNDVGDFGPLIRGRYPLAATPDTEDKEGLYLATSLNGRLPDGYLAHEEMQSGAFLPWINSQASISNTQKENFITVVETYLRWFSRLYEQPGLGESAWRSEHLEYNFSLELPAQGGKAEQLVADQYASGRLEWYAFDKKVETAEGMGTLPETVIQTFIPTTLSFGGMPHPRFWQMEENQTDFGKIDASPTALMSVLLAEYGLTYSNDYFVLPYELTINTLCEIKGIMVKDVFGINNLIEAAIDDPEQNWQTFALFHHTERDDNTIGRSRFYLTPTVGKVMESDPLEKVNFMRDEMSNMVWAIENRVPSEAGGGRDIKRHIPRLPQDYEPADEESKIRYVLGSTVPDNWIPFLPVHKPVEAGELTREIRLQRARLPQAPPPKSRLLSETQPVFFIEEEEVPRAGAIVARSFQRTRWLNGKTYLWVGRRKMAGRGEGWSGLMFDQILEVKRAAE